MFKRTSLALALISTSLSVGAEPHSLYSFLCNKNSNMQGYELSVGTPQRIEMYPGNTLQTTGHDAKIDQEWIMQHIEPDVIPPKCLSYFLSQGYWTSGQSIARFHFEFDSRKLTDEDKMIFARLVAALSNTPNVSVVGHTDNLGSDKYNQKLGQKRADEVVKQAMQQGENIMLTSSSRGESYPSNDNATETGRAYNRRVEVIFDDRSAK